MKIAFMGTPQFAADVLGRLLLSREHQIVCVVTQPDAAVGRGQKIQFNPVKKVAIQGHIPILQPRKISDHVNTLMDYQPDIVVTCAFGQILKQNVLDATPLGVINVHGSLLPKYRGAAPIQWAVINGEQKTGITIAKTELGLDCGPIICQAEINIDPWETAGDLFARLPEVAAEALLQALRQIATGTAKYLPQNDKLATKAPMLTKELAKLDWRQDAVQLANLVRGLNPWPVAFFLIDEIPVKVYRASALVGRATPGQIINSDAKVGLVIGCGNGLLRIDELQIAGKKRMSGPEFCRGRHLLTARVG